MIQLKQTPRPIALTDEIVAELTALFKTDTKIAVWKKAKIKNAIKEVLLKMSHKKCCYCECRLEIAAVYMEVEHFFPKAIFPDWVLLWSNLLPACKRCNINKSNLNVEKHPIVHPVNDVPSDHLVFNLYRLEGKTAMGKTTVQQLKLNDFDRLQLIRHEIGDDLMKELEILHENAERYFTAGVEVLKTQSRILDKMSDLMKLATPSSQFSATVSTILTNDINYQKVKQLLIENEFWTEEFEALEQEVLYCKLDLKNRLLLSNS